MIIELIKKIVNNYPTDIAYINKNCSITFFDLWNKSLEYANYLTREGNGPVIIYGDRSELMIITILSCIIAKRAYIPVGSCTPNERLKKIIEMSDCHLIINNSDAVLNEIDNLRLNDLIKFKEMSIKDNSNEVAYIMFTSGSTGNPKGVPITYSNLENFIKWISNQKPLNTYKHARILNQANYSFDLSVADIFYALCNGHTIVELDVNIQEEYEQIFDIIQINQVNIMVVTPTFMKLCLVNSEFNYNNYPEIKCIYFCGEPLSKNIVIKLYNQFPNIKIINAYGPTEATSAVSGILIDESMIDTTDLLPVGDMNSLASNITIINDEIIISGSSVFSGYLDNIEGGHYVENGINNYKTGDIGYIKNNMLYCSGRMDNQIKYKGYRIEVNDIEENIKKIPGVRDCAVIPIKDVNNVVKNIKAFIVSKNANEMEIKEKLAFLIPKYMIPKLIVFIETIPINENGKIDRKRLVQL